MQPSARRVLCWGLAVLLTGAACSSGSNAPASGAGAGWWRDRVFYEVFVRSYADSDGDGIGDLRGLVAHLDDLNDGDFATTTDLGVDALWLMPIFPSPSYHGYDVTDYRGVNPQYGELADVDVLVSAAHARGMKVLLDLVPNHTSSSHPWFQDSESGAGAAKRDWYVWSASQRPGTWYLDNGAWYYAHFTSSMPDLDYRTAGVEAEMVAVMKYWLARGIDGFRLDAVRYLVESDAGIQDTWETHALLQRMRAALQPEYPDALLVGEAWAPVETVAGYWGDGNELQLAFSFDLAAAVKACAAGGANAYEVINVLARTETALAGKDRGFEAPFLSNHDQDRVMRAVANPAAARLAAAALFAMPGTPFLYYGEELGMQGGTTDPDRRTPFRWDATPGYGFTTGTPWRSYPEAAGVDLATQRADAGSLWQLYRRLIALRHGAPGLSSAIAARPAVSGAGAGVLALLRGAAGERVLFVANFAATDAGPFTVSVSGTPAVLLAEGLGAAPSQSGGALAFAGLAARSWAFLSLP